MTELVKSDLMRAVVPLMSWSEILVEQGFNIPTSKIGTAFFIQYENEIYAITATHCLNNTEPKEIFIAIPGDYMKSLPLSTIIGSSYDDLPYIDTEIRVIKLSFLELLHKRLGDYPYSLSQEIINTPYFKRQIRLFRNGKIKNIQEIMDSKFYQNIKKSLDDKIRHAIEKIYTPELKILNLILSESADVSKGEGCQLLGYPNFGWDMDYNESSLKTLFRGISCKFLGYDTNTRDFVFEYQTDENLDGCSGGPILFNNQVIAVAHSVETSNKIIKATPFSKEFMKKLSL